MNMLSDEYVEKASKFNQALELLSKAFGKAQEEVSKAEKELREIAIEFKGDAAKTKADNDEAIKRIKAWAEQFEEEVENPDSKGVLK